MKRIVLATALILATPTIGNASMWDHPRVANCMKWDPARVSERDDLVRCVARNFDAAGTPAFALSVARCESGADLQDVSGADGHVGTYQHITSSWHSRWLKYGKPLDLPSSPTNVRSQAVVSLRMAKQGSWSPWSCAA